MLGAIAGDIIGSIFEMTTQKKTNFKLFSPQSHFTDDTVLTLAVAESLLKARPYYDTIREYGLRYPNRGYGGMFRQWLANENPEPYNSFGNGSAMRVSPIGFAFDKLYEVLAEAKLSAEVTHNHPEGIKGAEAIAACVFLARQGKSKKEIRDYVEDTFGYDLHRKITQIRPIYTFDVTCQGSVPEAIIAFLDSRDYETAIRLAVSLGGDTDTLAAMAGGIAQAYYQKIPYEIAYITKYKLGAELWGMVEEFNEAYDIKIEA
jgi:ADP-ribosylglycohydrolase